MVYSGSRKDALSYFANLGLEPPLHTNPLDYMLEISSVDLRTDEAEATTLKQVTMLIGEWEKYSSQTNPADVRQRSHKDDRSSASTPIDVEAAEAVRNAGTVKQAKRSSLMRQIMLLVRRTTQNLFRDRPLLLGFAAQTLVVGLVSGATFYLGAGPTNPSEVQTFKTILFQGHVSYFYLSLVLYIFLICGSLAVFDRERDDGLYGAIPMVVSTLLAYAPLNIVFSGVYGIICKSSL